MRSPHRGRIILFKRQSSIGGTKRDTEGVCKAIINNRQCSKHKGTTQIENGANSWQLSITHATPSV